MNKKVIKFFKNNWLYVLFLIFVMSLGYFLGTSLKVDAYHSDETTGNVISDNILNLNDVSSTTKNGLTYSVSNGVLTINGTVTYTFEMLIIPVDLELNQNYSLSYFNDNYTTDFQYGLYSDNNWVGGIYNNSGTFTNTMNVNNIRLTPVKGTTFNDQTFKPMVVEGSTIPTQYESYGKIYFYSQQSYDNAYNLGYGDGYDDGLIDNNTIPNIYIDVATYMYRTNLSGASVIPLDITSSLSGFSGVLDYSYVFTFDYPIFAYKDQYPTLYVTLLTPISVDDVLKFDLFNIDNIPNLESNAITFYYDENSAVSLSYQQIIDNSYQLSLRAIYPNISFDTFSSYFNTYYYSGDDLVSGIRTMTDISYSMSTNEQYDLGYKVGYVAGKNDGLVSGESLGYDKGYSEGYKKASQVVSKPGNNTLVGMMGTLIETPVNMFIDIFNFDFLGINLVAFFFSLLTLIIVVWLIKYLK